MSNDRRDEEMKGHDNLDLKEYKTIETRLYGELMKTCRRYSSDLNLISILGILDIVKQEIKDLDKTSRTFMKRKIPTTNDNSFQEKNNLDTIM